MDSDFSPSPLEPSPRRADDLLALLDGQVAATPVRLRGLEATVIRGLTAEDVLAAAEGQALEGPTSLGSIRYAHHRIAQLLCDGTPGVKVALLTGYSPGYITRLQADPVFRELLAYYAGQAEAVHVDSLERLKQLGLSAMDELQERLELKPEEFTKKDLIEIVKQAVPAGTGITGGSPTPAGPSVALTVQFVAPSPSGPAAAPIVETKFTRLPPEQEI